MRTACLIAVLWVVTGADCYGQARTQARTSAFSEAAQPRFKITRVGGQVYPVVSYTKKPPWYVFTGIDGKRSNHLISSVESIEPIPEEKADEAVADLKSMGDGASVSARLSPRTEARTQARTSFNTLSSASESSDSSSSTYRPGASSTSTRVPRSPAPPEPEPDNLSRSNAGYTPTGLPLHVGPRGGIYHFSASGKKVYQKRK